jgi:hypothetical protein
MTPQAFESAVKNYAKMLHMVNPTVHCLERMRERDITPRMVQRAILNGSLRKNPCWDRDCADWVGEMQGVAAGVELVVVCAIKDGVMTVTVVTTYPVGRTT